MLLDYLPFSRLMSLTSLLLTVVLLATPWVASFPGLLACVWATYLLAFAQFSTVPAQVRPRHHQSQDSPSPAGRGPLQVPPQQRGRQCHR